MSTNAKTQQHTPGPWGFAGNEVQKWVDHPAEGMTLLPIATAVHAANARLIAAAPDMLEALRVLVRIVRDAGPDSMADEIALADSAIAKASDE